MKQNVGTLDRAGRCFVALLMLRIALKKQGKQGVFTGFAAGDLIASVVSGYCPLYDALGINTVGKPL